MVWRVGSAAGWGRGESRVRGLMGSGSTGWGRGEAEVLSAARVWERERGGCSRWTGGSPACLPGAGPVAMMSAETAWVGCVQARLLAGRLLEVGRLVGPPLSVARPVRG